MSKKKEILKAIKNIEALPSASLELVKKLQNPDIEVRDIVKIVERDPGLTANILKTANSAKYSSGNKIDNIQTAIVRIGNSILYRTVVGSALKPIASKQIKGYDLSSKSFWEHSIGVSVGTEILAKILKKKIPDYIPTAGLLHDVGKIVLGTFFNVDTKDILKLAFQENIPFNEAEKEVLGMDHAEVGAELLHSWKFSDNLINAVRWHHQPDKAEQNDIGIDFIHAVDSLCMMAGFGIGEDGLNYRPNDDVFKRLELSGNISELTICNMQQEINDLIKVFVK